jgi:hypothetical protein
MTVCDIRGDHQVTALTDPQPDPNLTLTLYGFDRGSYFRRCQLWTVGEGYGTGPWWRL